MSDPYAPMFGRPVATWHRHFAWRPVNTLDRGWRWLWFVKRRRVQKLIHLEGPIDFWWQYVSTSGVDNA